MNKLKNNIKREIEIMAKGMGRDAAIKRCRVTHLGRMDFVIDELIKNGEV